MIANDRARSPPLQVTLIWFGPAGTAFTQLIEVGTYGTGVAVTRADDADTPFAVTRTE
jgi:hypothetical protein